MQTSQRKRNGGVKEISEKKLKGNSFIKGIQVAEAWRDFATGDDKASKKILRRLKKPHPNDVWFFLCITPEGFKLWEPHIAVAAGRFGIPMKWIYHSRSEGSKCQKMQAQWKMNFPHHEEDGEERVKRILEVLEHGEKVLGDTVAEAKKLAKEKGRKCGAFSFFKSKVNHSFMGFMAVPSRGKLKIGSSAPPGTVCMIQPYAMCSIEMGLRWVLYLEGKNSILDVYYNSFIELFENGMHNQFFEVNS